MLGRLVRGRGRSLRARLMVLSLAALLPGFAVIGITQYEIGRSRRAEVRELAVRSATQAGFEVDRIISGVQAILTTVALAPIVRGGDQEGCGAYLSTLAPSLPHLTGIAVLEPNGELRCSSLPPPRDAAGYSDRSYIGAALGSHEAVVGEYLVGRRSSRPVLPVSFAVRGPTGQPTGVLVTALDLAWLGERMRERGVPPGGSLTIADREGRILVRQPDPERFVGTMIPEAFRPLVTAPAAGAETVASQDGTQRILGYVPAGRSTSGLYVSAGLSEEASFGAVARAARAGALVTIACALATLGATWLVGSRAFIRPLRRMTSVLELFRRGDPAARTGFRDTAGEIGALGRALDLMMEEIARKQEERDLLANELEHRVKNTFATVGAIASSTLNKPVPARELLPEFQARLNALARTHDVLTQGKWEAAELHTLAAGVLRPLCDDIDTRFALTGPAVRLPPREALGMSMVLHELCTNALKYGALQQASGRVGVSWSVVDRPGGPALDLVWRETGGLPVQPPADRRGFGTRLIARAFGEQGQAVLSFDPGGLVCTVRVSLASEDHTAKGAQDAA